MSLPLTPTMSAQPGPQTPFLRFRALRASELTPLVGREDEIELLWRRWCRAQAGDGQIVLLSGEAGIGKSRLLAAFEQRLEDEAHTQLHFFCSPHHQDSTLYPIIARIERAARFARHDTAEIRLDKLETLLSRSGESPPEERALFADLMGLPTARRYPSFELDAQRKRELTMAAFVRQLELNARQQPVFFIFDDIHWIDSTSLELLDATVSRVPQLPVLLCLTFQPTIRSITSSTFAAITPLPQSIELRGPKTSGSGPKSVAWVGNEPRSPLPVACTRLTRPDKLTWGYCGPRALQQQSTGLIRSGDGCES
jgi:hypothetical protein